MIKIEFQTNTPRASLDMSGSVIDHSITGNRLVITFDHFQLPPNGMSMMFALGAQNIRMLDMNSTIVLVVKPIELHNKAAVDVVVYDILAQCEI